MRKYNSFTPVPSRQSAPAHSPPPDPRTISQAMEDWSKKKQIHSDEELSDNSEQESDGISFQLKTAAGVLSYKPSEHSNYTDFLRLVFEMMVAFNSTDVDPEFKKVIKKALAAYESGEDFDSDTDDDDDEDIDFVHAALENAKDEAAKYEQGVQYVNSLPKSEKLTLKILQSESESTTPARVEKILSKLTDLPPNVMHKVVRNNEPFSLPFEKASEVYVQLRMLGVILTVKATEDDSKKITTTKKVSAAKKSIKKSTAKSGRAKARTKTTRPTTKPILTGSEKLQTTVGIIKE